MEKPKNRQNRDIEESVVPQMAIFANIHYSPQMFFKSKIISDKIIGGTSCIGINFLSQYELLSVVK